MDTNGGPVTFVDDYTAWVTGQKRTVQVSGLKPLTPTQVISSGGVTFPHADAPAPPVPSTLYLHPQCLRCHVAPHTSPAKPSPATLHVPDRGSDSPANGRWQNPARSAATSAPWLFSVRVWHKPGRYDCARVRVRLSGHFGSSL